MFEWFNRRRGYDEVGPVTDSSLNADGDRPANHRASVWAKRAGVVGLVATALAGIGAGAFFLFKPRAGSNAASLLQTYQLNWTLVNNNADVALSLSFINKDDKPVVTDIITLNTTAQSLSSLQGIFAGANVTKEGDLFTIKLFVPISIPAMVNGTAGTVSGTFTLPLPTSTATLVGSLVSLPDNISLGLSNTTKQTLLSFDGSQLVTSSPIKSVFGTRTSSLDKFTTETSPVLNTNTVDPRINTVLAGYAGVAPDGTVISLDDAADYNSMFWEIDLIQRARQFVDLTIEVNPVNISALAQNPNATAQMAQGLKALGQETGAKSFLITPVYPAPITPAFEAALLDVAQCMQDHDCNCDLYLPFNQSFSSKTVSSLKGIFNNFYQPTYDATPYVAGESIHNIIPDQRKLNNTRGIPDSQLIPLVPNSQICGEAAQPFNSQFPLNNTASGTTPGGSPIFPGIYSQQAIMGQSTGLNPPPGQNYVFIPSAANDGINVVNIQPSGTTPVVCTGVGDIDSVKNFVSKGSNAVVSRQLYNGVLHDSNGVPAITVVGNVIEGVDPKAQAPQPASAKPSKSPSASRTATRTASASHTPSAQPSNHTAEQVGGTGRKLQSVENASAEKPVVTGLLNTAALTGGTVLIGKVAEDVVKAMGVKKEDAQFISAGINSIVPLLLIAITSEDRILTLQLAMGFMVLMYVLQRSLQAAKFSPLNTGLIVGGVRTAVSAVNDYVHGKPLADATLNAVANTGVSVVTAVGTNALYEGGRYVANRSGFFADSNKGRAKPSIEEVVETPADQHQAVANKSPV
jgi:hypothetical protein